MADIDTDLNVLLRERHTGVRDALSQAQAKGKPLSWMTSYLLNAIQTGATPASVFDQYLHACHHDIHAVRAGLEQTYDDPVREAALRHLIKLLRSGTSFVATWSELGGARGLAKLMGQLSVNHVKLLCRGLATTANIPGARVERQQAISELFEQLYGIHETTASTDSSSIDSEWHDPRPLRAIYSQLIGACTQEACIRWDQDPRMPSLSKYYNFQRVLHRYHPDTYPAQVLEEHFAPLEPGTPPADLPSALNFICYFPGRERLFTLEVFKMVVAAGPDRFVAKPRDILDRFANPLLNHLQKHGGGREGFVRSQVWDLVFACYEKWNSFAQETYMPQWTQYLHHAVNWWKWTKSEESKADALRVLKRLLELIRVDDHGGWNLDRITSFLTGAKLPAARRYELFCVILRHYRRFNIRIDSPTEEEKLKLRSIQDVNMCEIFTLFPPDKALQLLEIYIYPKSPGFFVRKSTYPRSILCLAEDEAPGYEAVDLEILHYFLRHQASGKPQKVGDLLEGKMAKANQSRAWEGRAFWAKSALFLSIASGDLELYSQTLSWAQKFHRDHRTVTALYAKDCLGTKEGLRLLSGVPTKTRLHLRSVDEVGADVMRGNKIVFQLLGLVREGLGEAGISTSTWSYVTSGGSLASDIFKMRARFSNDFQRYHGLSDKQVFALIWKPTIDMFFGLEAFALEERHLKYNLCKATGHIGLDQVGTKNVTTSHHVWKFCDELARARDGLWSRMRYQRFPETLDLPSIWPRGLPAHLLCRLGSSNQKFNSSNLPYVLSRAKRVVFANPDDAFSPQPEDQRTQLAVGSFVDSYGQCLKIYLDADGEDDTTTRAERSLRAWAHATTALSQGRMSSEEAAVFWRQWVRYWVHFGEEKADVRAVTSSNKSPEGGGEPRRYLPPMSLDVILQNNDTNPTINGLFQKGHYPEFTYIELPSTRARSTATYGFPRQWNYEGNREALVAAALQLLDGRSEKYLEMMKLSLPDHEDTLFCMDAREALMILSQFQDSTSVEVLRDLALHALQNDQSEPEVVVGLIRLIIKSNRPWEACSPIQDLVVAGPRYSGWHRRVLTSGFLNRLPAGIAKEFIQDLGQKISERLEAPKPATDIGITHSSISQPSIKITTVKMLAEVLRVTWAVDFTTGTAILMRIFLVAKHIDIRAAVIQSLLDAFDKTDNDQLRESIFSALRENAVGVAASLDERFPMSEEDWARTETDGNQLPGVAHNAPGIISRDNQQQQDVRPISRLLLGQLTRPRPGQSPLLDPAWRARWYTDIVMGIVIQSIANNKRWMRLFLALNDFGLEVSEQSAVQLPSVPAEPILLLEEILLEKGNVEFLKRDTLETLRQVALFHVTKTPDPINRINKAIREKSIEIRGGKNAADHWILCCGTRGHYPSAEVPSSVRKVAALLEDPPLWLSERSQMAAEGHITIHHLQDYLFTIIEAVVMEYPASRGLLDRLMTGVIFRHVLGGGSGPGRTIQAYQTWRTNMLPIAQRVLQLVEAIRLNQRAGANTGATSPRPRSLPDTFPYKIYMLPLPSTIFNNKNKKNNNEQPTETEGMSVFCSEIYHLVDFLARRAVDEGVPYHANWKVLKEFVCKHVAAGDDDEWGGQGSIVSWEIAVGLWSCDGDREVVGGVTGRHDPVIQSGGARKGPGREVLTEVGDGGGGHEKLRTGLVFELVSELISRGAGDWVNNRQDVVLSRVREMLGCWIEGEDCEEWMREVAVEMVEGFKGRTGSVHGDLARGGLQDLWDGLS